MTAYEMAKDGLGRMTIDLESLFILQPPAFKISGSDDTEDPFRLVGDIVNIGGEDVGKLRFTALAHIPLDRQPRDGVAEIIYYVNESRDGNRVLQTIRPARLHRPARRSERRSDSVRQCEKSDIHLHRRGGL